jgi:hypothetical protein
VGDTCPELRAAWRDGALSWLQAQILVPLLATDAEGAGAGGGDWRSRWIRFARQVTLRRLEEAVEEALVVREADPERWERCREAPGSAARFEPGERQVCARATAAVEGISLRVTVPREVARLFRAVLCSWRKALEARTGRLPSEAEAFEAMLDHALASWGVGRKNSKRFAVFERDGWRCSVPGCTSHRNLHAHHIRYRSAGGGDDPANLTTLCAAHHLRGVHAGIVCVSGRAPDGLLFELPLGRYRSGEVVA